MQLRSLGSAVSFQQGQGRQVIDVIVYHVSYRYSIMRRQVMLVGNQLQSQPMQIQHVQSFAAYIVLSCALTFCGVILEVDRRLSL